MFIDVLFQCPHISFAIVRQRKHFSFRDCIFCVRNLFTSVGISWRLWLLRNRSQLTKFIHSNRPFQWHVYAETVFFHDDFSINTSVFNWINLNEILFCLEDICTNLFIHFYDLLCVFFCLCQRFIYRFYAFVIWARFLLINSTVYKY